MQEKYLNTLRKKKIICRFFTTNGFQMQGIVVSFDSFAIVIEDETHHQNMIYKHAISTISPAERVDLTEEA